MGILYARMDCCDSGISAEEGRFSLGGIGANIGVVKAGLCIFSGDAHYDGAGH